VNQTRREALITIAGAAVAGAAPSDGLTPAELKWVGVLADAIIPRTDTPGASDVGVPQFIAARLAHDAKLAARFREGMAALDAESKRKFNEAFPEITPGQQVELLTPMQSGEFFQLVKGWTVDGYYSSKPGLTQELGWHANTYVAEFKGCTHPEHQS
jgi:hypothetical protein